MGVKVSVDHAIQLLIKQFITSSSKIQPPEHNGLVCNSFIYKYSTCIQLISLLIRMANNIVSTIL